MPRKKKGVINFIARGFMGEPKRKNAVPKKRVSSSDKGHTIFKDEKQGAIAHDEMLRRHEQTRKKLAEERAFRERKKQAAIKVRTTHFKKLGKSNRKNLKKAWNKIW